MTQGPRVGRAAVAVARRRWRSSRPLVCIAALLAMGGCTHAQRAGAETAVAKALISDEEENQIGAQVKQELVEKEHVRFVSDPTVVSFVKGITDRILPLAEKARPGVKWEVNVIDDPKTVNAFATPGGHLYVYTGLILAASNPAEFAGVLAHEAGHVVARHSARQMVDAYGLQAVTALALGKNPGLASQVATGIAGKGLMLANSREDETEADEYGATFANDAGYDPHGLITFFQKLQQQEGKTPSLMKFLSDHPATPDRITHLEQYIAQRHLASSAGREPDGVPAVQQRLKASTPAPAPTPAPGPVPAPAG